MNPLVDDFLGGKSGLLVAMCPTGSGKTHTIFGSPRNPGILPLTLRQIFNAQDENKVASQPARSFSLSMFEILSEGKGERILDLLSDATECVLQQSSIKGLQEVPLVNLTDAESLVSRGTLKRSTAATNANSNRSQCIITIRGVHKRSDADSEHLLSNAVLTIADLAGAEQERKTGNQGSRLLESNFINNTSMVFGLCLRSLLEHQKNQKKPLEKHFKNSMILNVKPADDDYLDTSFLLRQASLYMKIKYTSLEDSSDLVSQKRSNASSICQENKKKRKVQKPEVLGVEQKENIETDNIAKVSEENDTQHKFLNSELRRESENAAKSMKQLIRDQDIQIVELKKELEVLNSCCSCKNVPVTEDTSIDQDDSVSSGQAGRSLGSLSNKPNLGSYHASVDNFHLVAEEVSKELKSHGPENSSGESVSCDASSISLIDEQEQSSGGLKVEVQAIHKKLDASECFTEQTSAHTGEHHMLPCLKTERVSLSPQFTSCSKKATIEQSEDETEESCKITVEDIHHDVSRREVKHPDYLSSSQRVSSDTDVSSSQSSLEFPGMVAPQKKLEELDLEPDRCEPGVVNATVECGIGPNKVSEAEEAADKNEEGSSSSRPRDTKKTRRRLQPAAAMMLKEFTGADLDVDTKREERGKSPSSAASWRSDALIRLLKARPVRRA
ncbi:hypothetical protein C2845_PM12G00370 [Panicum miliaceum]|uniref:Kinesin motor domain-containing protein n=1 Tax=Panicum miliaceum TaxID=4540 RepID=A0A3L6QJZ6_PANMI|nr:hypothetical protein C2845_PM12G00370 [Panicum miliaceum]